MKAVAKSMRILSLVAAICFSAGIAMGHPACLHPEMALIAQSQAPASSKEEEPLDYCYRLCARLIYESPAPNQPRLTALMREIAAIQLQFPDRKPTEEILRQAEAIFAELEASYGCVGASWENEALVLTPNQEPLLLTRNIPRHFLLKLFNRTPVDKVVALSGPDGLTGVSFNLPAGATRLWPAHTMVAEDAPVESIVVQVHCPAANEVRSLSVPVRTQFPAVLRGQLLDADTNSVFPGRLYVIGSDGCYRYAAENGTNTTLTEKMVNELLTFRYETYRLPFSYSSGRFELLVPPGRTELMLERGYEHSPARETVELAPQETRDVVLRAERFVDMREKGWHSGDTHVHWVKNSWDTNEDMGLLELVQRAEDLRVANNLTLYQYRPGEQGGPFVKPDHFPMGPVTGHSDSQYSIHMAEEYRNDNFYGHLIFLNIAKLIMPIATGQGSGGPVGTPDYPLNKNAILEARAQGGISIEAHNIGPKHCSDVPVNVVSGLADSLDQLDPELYYRFLDLGVRIPLSNGSDHPARLAGSARVYVKVDGSYTYEKWIDGIRQGRTFTTSGPLLFLSVNGKDIGDAVKLGRGEMLHITAQARSRAPIGRLQIVMDGKVIKELESDSSEATVEMEIPAECSGWLVARCSQNNQFNAINASNIAHTSPVYLEVDGKALFRPESAEFWLGNMRQHVEDIQKNAVFENDAHREEEMAYIQSAIRVLEERIADAGKQASSPASAPKETQLPMDVRVRAGSEEYSKQPISPLIYGNFLEMGFGRQVEGLWGEMLFNRSFEEVPPYRGNHWWWLRRQPGDDLSKEDWWHSGYREDAWKLAPDNDQAKFQIVEFGGFRNGYFSAWLLNDHPEKEAGLIQEGVYLKAGETYRFRGALRVPKEMWDLGPNGCTLNATLRICAQGAPDKPLHQLPIQNILGDYDDYSVSFVNDAYEGWATFGVWIPPMGRLNMDDFSLMPESSVDGWRKDVVNTLRAAAPPILRWPGGCFASFYDWREGTGLRSERHPRPSAFWGGLNDNDVGTLEYASFCKLLGAQPMICVNILTGSPESAAEWVAYCNAPVSNPQGALRAKDGSAEALGVTYWELDNEAYRKYGPQEYAQQCVVFSKAMKAVDPSIRTIMQGYANYFDALPQMLEIAGRDIDLVTDRNVDEPSLRRDLAVISEYNARNNTHIQLCNTEWLAQASDVPAKPDEFNKQPLPEDDTLQNRQIRWRYAMNTARQLLLFQRLGGEFQFANFNNLANTWGQNIIECPKEASFLSATGRVFELFSTSPAAWALKLEQLEPVPGLQWQAAWDMNHERLIVYVLNYNAHPAMVRVDIGALGKTFSHCNTKQVYAESLSARNSVTDPDAVKTEAQDTTITPSATLEISSRPYSVLQALFSN